MIFTKKLLSFTLTTVGLLLTPAAFSQTHTDRHTLAQTPVVESTEQKIALSLTTGIAAIQAVDSVTGIDLAFRFRFALQPRWAIAADVAQGLNLSGFNTLYTALSAQAIYAPNAPLTRETQTTRVNGQVMSQSTTHIPKGWFINGGVKQYLFHGSSNVFPVIGPTLGAYYQFGSSKEYSLQAGVSVDMGQNASRTLSCIRIFIGAIGFN